MLIFYPCFFTKTHLYQKRKVDLEITFIPSRSEPTGTMLQFGVIINQLVQISKVYKWVQLKGAISQAKSASKSEKHPKKRSLRRRGGAKKAPLRTPLPPLYEHIEAAGGEHGNRKQLAPLITYGDLKSRTPKKIPYMGLLSFFNYAFHIGTPGGPCTTFNYGVSLQ